MKYRLTFKCITPVTLPVQYNHILQAAILQWLGDESYSTFLHDEGYVEQKRKYKLFCFSNLYGKYNYDAINRKISFYDIIQFYCTFYSDENSKIISDNVEAGKRLILGKNELVFEQCQIMEECYEDCIVETVSPITMHTTFLTGDGRKKTYYYEPHERDFSDMIRQNLLRKYRAYYGREPESQEFSIECIGGKHYKSVSIYYQKFLIKGWSGKFKLTGSEELIKLALLSGIGDRNSVGLGCVIQKV